jgi:hypothetical protein
MEPLILGFLDDHTNEIAVGQLGTPRVFLPYYVVLSIRQVFSRLSACTDSQDLASLWRFNPEQEPEFALKAPAYLPLRRQRLISMEWDSPLLLIRLRNFLCTHCPFQFTFHLVELMLYFPFTCDRLSLA